MIFEELKQKWQNILDKSNEVTSKSDTNVTDAVKSLIEGYGQGGGYSFEYNEYLNYPKSNISSNGWNSTNGTPAEISTIGENITIDTDGTYKMSGGRIVVDTPDSSVAVCLRCKINSDFVPIQSDWWYLMSCVIGCELGGSQKDYSCVISADGYFCIGYSTLSILKTDFYALDDEWHDICLIGTAGRTFLIIDGREYHIDYGWNGDEIRRMGIFWNNANPSTSVKGNIELIKVCTYTENLNFDNIKNLFN